MDLGYKKPLMDSDLYQLEPENDAEVVTDRLESQWREELRRQSDDVAYKPSLGKAFMRTFWREYLAGVIPRLVKVLGSFVAPFLLQNIIKFVEDPNSSTLYGISLLLILFVRSQQPFECQTQSHRSSATLCRFLTELHLLGYIAIGM